MVLDAVGSARVAGEYPRVLLVGTGCDRCVFRNSGLRLPVEQVPRRGQDGRGEEPPKKAGHPS